MRKLKLTIQSMLLVAGLVQGGISSAGGHGGPAYVAPIITKTALHKERNAIIIIGRNFGTTLPTVTLADQVLNVKRYSEQEIVASLPSDFAAATYSLTVTSNGQKRASSEPFNATLPEK